ncbi:UNVERIFIED_CONTAM: hypothetical protein GTU68_024150 [Idotea baltica]|nr:hypothetical protein [Idotea baltica]
MTTEIQYKRYLPEDSEDDDVDDISDKWFKQKSNKKLTKTAKTNSKNKLKSKISTNAKLIKETSSKVQYKRYLPGDSDDDDVDNISNAKLEEITDDSSDEEAEKSFQKKSNSKSTAKIMNGMKVKKESDDSCSEDEESTDDSSSEEEENTMEEKKEEDEDQEEDSGEEAPEFPSETFLSNIKNKLKYRTNYRKMKKEKKIAKRELKRIKQRESEMLGKKLVKKIPHTIESKREVESYIPENDDEDILQEESMDKYADYYSKKYEPKVLITTSEKVHGRTVRFVKELSLTIPNADVQWRNRASVKKVVKLATEKGYTDVLIVNEDHRLPNGLLIIHLPDGPTACFKLSNVKTCKDIKRRSKSFTGHRPELILNNFKTHLGRLIGRMLGALYHYEPEFKGRVACTFHNQRDYIFFRHHRYEFKNTKKVALRELGPRFTMRLEWLQDGPFDGDFEWTLKRHEMETSRRKFNL